MGFIDRLLGREKRSTPVSTSDPYLAEFFGQRGHGDVGGNVSPYAVENLSAVFACVQIISETIATLPPSVYRLPDGGGRIAVPNHAVSRVLASPNEWQTAPEFLETLIAHCLLRGNGYAEIVRNGRGEPVALNPLHPDSVSVLKLASGRLVYDVVDVNGAKRRLLADEILHLKDRSDDGIVGKSRLQRARETFATASATERFAGNVFKNGASLSGVLSHPEQLGDEAAQRLRTSFDAIYKGSDNAGKIAILEEGLKFQAISVSPDDAQMLESRRFGVENIARIFRVPPPVLGDLSNGSYSNVTELGRWFHQHTIMPWLVKLERLIERALFSDASRSSHEVEFDCDLLVRGDMLQRFQSYRIGREVGLYSANDLRKFEKLNPRSDADADVFLSPMNMQAEQTGAPKE